MILILCFHQTTVPANHLNRCSKVTLFSGGPGEHYVDQKITGEGDDEAEMQLQEFLDLALRCNPREERR